jgi:hypothetical protein
VWSDVHKRTVALQSLLTFAGSLFETVSSVRQYFGSTSASGHACWSTSSKLDWGAEDRSVSRPLLGTVEVIR